MLLIGSSESSEGSDDDTEQAFEAIESLPLDGHAEDMLDLCAGNDNITVSIYWDPVFAFNEVKELHDKGRLFYIGLAYNPLRRCVGGLASSGFLYIYEYQ